MSMRNPLQLPRIETEDVYVLIRALKDIMHGILIAEQRPDTSIREVLRAHRYSSEQRTLIVESAYALLRSWEVLRSAPWKREPKPIHIVGLWFTLAGGVIPDELRIRYIPEEIDALLDACEKTLDHKGIFAFFPNWFNERCEKELGHDLWHDIAMSQITEPRTFIRTNTPDKIFASEAFKKGMFEMQDIASQMIAPMLKVTPQFRVIDACAGEGGKTLHIAALMENKGRLIAMDIHQYKLDELKRRTRRAGAWNIETRLIETSKDIKKLKSSADAVLIDAPCSGTGVLRRNPDTLMKKSNASIDELMSIQDELLSSYSSMVKPGGCLVYASCSILPSEGEDRIQKFLQSEKGKDWTLEEDRRLCPAKDGFDGFYCARLRKSS